MFRCLAQDSLIGPPPGPVKASSIHKLTEHRFDAGALRALEGIATSSPVRHHMSKDGSEMEVNEVTA